VHVLVKSGPYHGPIFGSALHVMLFLENTLQALFIFNGLRSRHCQRALLGYHYLLSRVLLGSRGDDHALKGETYGHERTHDWNPR
jgi:hypothetical protein